MTISVFANTFLSVDEADTRIGPFDTRWAGHTTAEKEQWLSNASALLNDQDWLSSVVDSSQVMSWPRLTFDFYDPSANAYVTVTQGEIPERLLRAVAALASHLGQNPNLLDNSLAIYENITVGPITLSDTRGSFPGFVPVIPYSTVLKSIKPLLRGAYRGSFTPWLAA